MGMTSLRVVGPGWGYAIVFGALTVPAVLNAASQEGGLGRALFIGIGVLVLLFGWWRRGVWFANDDHLVVVNWVKRQVIRAEGARLEIKPLGARDWTEDLSDPRRVKTLALVGADGTRVRIRVVDGASGPRIRRAVDSIRAVLDVANGSDQGETRAG